MTVQCMCRNWASSVPQMEQWTACPDEREAYGSSLEPVEDIQYHIRGRKAEQTGQLPQPSKTAIISANGDANWNYVGQQSFDGFSHFWSEEINRTSELSKLLRGILGAYSILKTCSQVLRQLRSWVWVLPLSTVFPDRGGRKRKFRNSLTNFPVTMDPSHNNQLCKHQKKKQERKGKDAIRNMKFQGRGITEN